MAVVIKARLGVGVGKYEFPVILVTKFVACVMSAETGFSRVRTTMQRGVDLVLVDMTISFRLVDSGTVNE
jgi:hypothetical protein